MSNLNKTCEIISHLTKSNKPGIIPIVNYGNCFDHMNIGSIKGAQKYLNYSDKFTDIVLFLYSNFAACTQNIEHLLNFFDKQRGVQQWYPTSPGIYTQTSAIISHMIDKQERRYQRYL